MKISYNWLSDYVAHGLAPRALADALTMCGLEVEGVETVGTALEGVVVGHVRATRPHPNADRLTLCDVDLGGDAPVQIVCGAPNVAPGQRVPVATVGTTLLMPSRQNPTVREPFTIQKAALRGEASEGMICSEDELGLSEDHTGIMVLSEDAPVGQPFGEYLKARGAAAQDAILDVSITPNRPDATSHIGVARDVAALTGRVLRRPEVALPQPGEAAADAVRVEIQAPEACSRYVAILVRGVRIGPSPAWLQRRLAAVGLRPRNNVVDVTNYVMYECGQPLHAFDFDRLAGSQIAVRLTGTAAPFTTLDGREHILPEDALLICDAERPVAVAGVMGGENSEVTEETVNLLIESAHFDPTSIRRTARALGLQTDASYRFERGVDPDGQVWAAARAAHLIAELTGAAVVPGMVDARTGTVERREVTLRPSRLKRILGHDVPLGEVRRLLTAIGFDVEEDEWGAGEEVTLRCLVPTFRPDVEREIDMIEEVARLYGYDRIEEPAHMTIPSRVPGLPPSDTLRRQVLARLGGLGFREIYTNSMLPRETAQQFNLPVLHRGRPGDAVVETLNPISQEMAALRPSLLPGLLQVMSFNQNRGQRVLRFVEFGHVYHRTDRIDTLVPGYAEQEACLIALSGPRAEAGWDVPEQAADFFDLKGVVESLLDALHLPDVEMTPGEAATPVTAAYLDVHAGGHHLGLIARLSGAAAERFDLKADVYFAELDWQRIVQLAAPYLRRSYVPVSRFPVVERDLAVVVDRAAPVGPMLQTIRAAGGPLLQRVSVFDLYEGERIEAGRKSVAFALRFGAARTLQDEEVDVHLEAIIGRLQEEHAADLRR